jgi:ketosteroid isomerase-like protein
MDSKLRPVLVPLALVVVLLALAACTIERADVRTPSGEPPAADTTRVRMVLEEISVAFETADLSGLDTIYHDSVTVYEGGSVDRGWQSYRDGHLVPELQVLEDRRLEFDEIRIRLAGSTAWMTCRFRLSGIGDEGEVAVSGLQTMVLQRLSNRWRIVHVHTSAGRN